MPNWTPKLALLVVVGSVCTAASLSAQSYRDFMIVRNRPQPYQSLLQLRAGWAGVAADDETPGNGHESDNTIDGFILYHSKEFTRARDWALDFYAGTDGAYLSFKDDLYHGKKSQNRFEIFGRPRSFYREGYYQAGKYVVTGQYEGQDWGARIGNAQLMDRGLILDLSIFYKQFSFSKTDDPATSVDFTIPDDYSAYGAAVVLEQNTLELDRRLGVPRQGLLWTVRAEYERNDSSQLFGFSPGYTSELPKAVYRGETHLEIYSPNGQSGVWEIMLDGGYYDSEDRVISYRAERVQGHIWGDGSIGYRVAAGTSFLLKPYFALQYSKSLKLDGLGSREKVFWGGGVDMSLIFSENLALVANYSYLDNPSRSHVGIERDYYGEHQFFIGMDVSFGSGYGSRRR